MRTDYAPVLPGMYPEAVPTTVTERHRQKTFTTAVAAYFAQHPGVWISALDLERVGGRQAWRTRVSDCRTVHGMTIANRQRTMRTPTGTIRVSEYRYEP